MKNFMNIIFLINLVACATVSGSRTKEAELKEFLPVRGKVSLYVCREPGLLFNANGTFKIIVNDQAIGDLRQNNFTHTLAEPGKTFVRLSLLNNIISSGTLEVQGNSNDVIIIWAGITGGGWCTQTVDYFNNKAEGEKCVKNADYKVALPN